MSGDLPPSNGPTCRPAPSEKTEDASPQTNTRSTYTRREMIELGLLEAYVASHSGALPDYTVNSLADISELPLASPPKTA